MSMKLVPRHYGTSHLDASIAGMATYMCPSRAQHGCMSFVNCLSCCSGPANSAQETHGLPKGYSAARHFACTCRAQHRAAEQSGSQRSSLGRFWRSVPQLGHGFMGQSHHAASSQLSYMPLAGSGTTSCLSRAEPTPEEATTASTDPFLGSAALSSCLRGLRNEATKTLHEAVV